MRARYIAPAAALARGELLLPVHVEERDEHARREGLEQVRDHLQGDVGRCGEMWGDVGEMWGDVGG